MAADTRHIALAELGDNCYPHIYRPTGYKIISTLEFQQQYSTIEAQAVADDFVAVVGRVFCVPRAAGKKLIFMDLLDADTELQIMVNAAVYQGDLAQVAGLIRYGDVIGVCGQPHRTKSGELSLLAHKVTLLSPCMQTLPQPNQLTDPEIRFRQRYMDLVCTKGVQETFKRRSDVIKFIRRFLEDNGFLEVDTPVLNTTVGGAIAAPFVTMSNDFKIPMFMRISPELFLKQLIIGGFNRVFELGRQYRNESNDTTHNAEFTSLELYQRNADYEDMLILCERIISTLVFTIHGEYVIEYDGKKIDFTPPFRRVDMIGELEAKLGVKIGNLSREELDATCVSLNVPCSSPRTVARLLDKLVGAYVEVDCINPTFVMHHPMIMSPLAKQHRTRPEVAERFELFVNRFEIANAYTEQNNPEVQTKMFQGQGADRANGDEEAMMLDASFITALEYGLPPTGGLGIGIDRLVMLMTGHTSIREVLLFPTMKPQKIVV